MQKQPFLCWGGMQKSYAENTKKLDDNSSSFEVTDPGIEPGIQP
jgi:hypothetical protein